MAIHIEQTGAEAQKNIRTLATPHSMAGKTASDGTHTNSPVLMQASVKDIEPIIRDLEFTSALLHRKLRYSIHSELQRVIVKVVDSETDKVIKELPPEELQRISLRIREAVGLLIDEEI